MTLSIIYDRKLSPDWLEGTIRQINFKWASRYIVSFCQERSSTFLEESLDKDDPKYSWYNRASSWYAVKWDNTYFDMNRNVISIFTRFDRRYLSRRSKTKKKIYQWFWTKSRTDQVPNLYSSSDTDAKIYLLYVNTYFYRFIVVSLILHTRRNSYRYS